MRIPTRATGFLAAIHANPQDVTAIGAFHDWTLEELYYGDRQAEAYVCWCVAYADCPEPVDTLQEWWARWFKAVNDGYFHCWLRYPFYRDVAFDAWEILSADGREPPTVEEIRRVMRSDATPYPHVARAIEKAQRERKRRVLSFFPEVTVTRRAEVSQHQFSDPPVSCLLFADFFRQNGLRLDLDRYFEPLCATVIRRSEDFRRRRWVYEQDIPAPELVPPPEDYGESPLRHVYRWWQEFEAMNRAFVSRP